MVVETKRVDCNETKQEQIEDSIKSSEDYYAFKITTSEMDALTCVLNDVRTQFGENIFTEQNLGNHMSILGDSFRNDTDYKPLKRRTGNP